MHFNIDNRFWEFVTTCTRFFLLNIVLIATLIPVVTVGPARTALYGTLFAYDDHDDIRLVRQYLRRFVTEFPRSFGASMLFVALLAADSFGMVYWASSSTVISYIALTILILAAAILITAFEYFFPLQARYTNTFTGTLRNSMRMPWAVPGTTALLVAIDITAGVTIAFSPHIRVAFVLLGFSWLAYVKSLLFLRAFARVGDQRKNEDRSHDYSLPQGTL